MPLPQLLAALEAEATEQRAAHARRAEAEAERIEADAREAVRRRRADAVARAEREESESARRSLATTYVDAARAALEARARLLDRVRRAVDVRVEGAAEDPAYAAALPGEVAVALARLPTAAEAHAAPELLVRLEAALDGALDAAVQAPLQGRPAGRVRGVPVPGMPVGFRLVSGDGATEVDATLRAKLDLAWPGLAVRVVAELEPAPSAAGEAG